MRLTRLSGLVLVGCAALSCSAPSTRSGGGPADVVLRGGRVYTVDPRRPWAEALAVRDGIIVRVGSDGAVSPFIGPRTQVIELRGKMVLPAFWDSHLHPVTSGIAIGECLLTECSTREELVATIRACADRKPGTGWIRGEGWALPLFPSANPSRALLDEIAPGRPVYLVAADGHSAWVSSRALALAKVTARTPDPPRGRIERDPASKEPSGTLREEAMQLVERHLPARTPEDYRRGLRRALALAHSAGLAALLEANADEKLLDAYAELDRRGELTARVTVALEVDLAKGVAAVPRYVELRRRYRGRHLQVSAAKIFVDGVMEAHTAALLAPYLDRPGFAGKANIEGAPLRELAVALDRERFQIHVHAIGDRAVRETLDALAAARQRNGPRDARHHIAHLQLIDPTDLPRFRSLGVIANVQPLWAYADKYITELTEPILGAARSRWLYPIGSLARSGATLVCGSDWNVSSMSPLEGMQVAITRQGLEAKAAPPWRPEERVDLATMIACYTREAARASFQEKQTGTIEEGKAADLVVLDRNLFSVPPRELHKVRVLLTLVEGRVVFVAPGR
jgi:hypothetical protein